MSSDHKYKQVKLTNKGSDKVNSSSAVNVLSVLGNYNYIVYSEICLSCHNEWQ